MIIDEIVRLLHDYLIDEGATLRRQVGPRAVTVAEDAISFLSTRLEADSVQLGAWSRFLSDPSGRAAELTGALEALSEADPTLSQRLNALVEDYRGLRVSSSAPPDVGSRPRPTLADEPLGERIEDMETEAVAREDAEIGGGAYLYGNLSAGDTPPEGQVSQPTAAEQGRPMPPRGVSIGRETVLESLEEILGQHLDDTNLRMRVRVEVVAMFDEIVRSGLADQAVVERHLWSISQVSPGLVRDIVEAMEEWPVDREVLRGALLNVTSAGRGENEV